MSSDPRILSPDAAAAIIGSWREFLRGLRLAQGIADRKSTMPMLANILLRAQKSDGREELSALLDHAEALAEQARNDRPVIDAAIRLIAARRTAEILFADVDVHDIGRLSPSHRRTLQMASDALRRLDDVLDERAREKP